MENASKALLMAAGVLIGMLVLSLAVYLFVTFGTQSATIHKQQAMQQLEQFNTQFTSYIGRQDITIYDIVTVANLATENNIYYEFKQKASLTDGKDFYISVRLDDNTLSSRNRGMIEKAHTNIKDINYNELIEEAIRVQGGTLANYKCQVEMSESTRKSLPSNFFKKIIEKS
ncbi:MAG: hypothetical protein HFJ33_01995 [Clostridia bacterium]|nr:hypothetical protein [Clostridia bacterium]